MTRSFILLFSLLLFTPKMIAQDWIQQSKFTPIGPQSLGNLGVSIAISDSFMIAGAWTDDHSKTGANLTAGSAYIYKLNSENEWHYHQKILPSTLESLMYFGFAVDIDGQSIFVGAYNENSEDGSLFDVGSVYVYQLNTSGEWIQSQKLRPTVQEQAIKFGKALSVSGDFLLVGADRAKTDVNGSNPMNDSGAAYLFKKTGGTWNFHQKLVAPDRSSADRFGKYVDISGNQLIIGAEDKDDGFHFDAGAAYIFQYDNNTDEWSHAQKLLPNDIRAFLQFGWDVAIDGGHALVGASSDLGPQGSIGSNSGTVNAFERNSSGHWEEKQKIYPEDISQNDFFGREIDVEGGLAIIGAEFEDEDQDGNQFVSGAGSAYIFQFENGQWVQQAKLIGTDRQINDQFGYSAALHFPYVAIGAVSADVDQVNDAGAAYVFKSDQIISHVKQNISHQAQIYPNPSTGLLHIKNSESNQFSVYDVDGQFVFRFTSHSTHPIDLTALKPGMYFIQSEDIGHVIQHFKWIKL